MAAAAPSAGPVERYKLVYRALVRLIEGVTLPHTSGNAAHESSRTAAPLPGGLPRPHLRSPAGKWSGSCRARCWHWIAIPLTRRSRYTPGRPTLLARPARTLPCGVAVVALAQPAEHRNVDPQVTGGHHSGSPGLTRGVSLVPRAEGRQGPQNPAKRRIIGSQLGSQRNPVPRPGHAPELAL